MRKYYNAIDFEAFRKTIWHKMKEKYSQIQIPQFCNHDASLQRISLMIFGAYEFTYLFGSFGKKMNAFCK